MGGHAIQHAVARANIDPESVEDVIMGCGMPQGTQSQNIA
jgi:acetyl-CoA acetyltransferase